jgi:NADPH2:quinone reductase
VEANVRAIRVEEFGGPEVLKLVEMPDPEPGEGQLLVQIKATGLNFIETYQRSGAYPITLPRTLGTEAAGVVLELGAGVTGFDPGDRVVFNGSTGSYADLTLVPAAATVKLGDDVPFDTGVALYLQGLTAHALCTSVYPIQPGEWSLVHAGAGGVGLLLTQMIKMRGAHVIATVSTEEKAALARGAGADEVILYSKEDFVAEVARITDGAKLPVVYDSVGKDTFEGSIDCLRSRGYMVLFGQSSGRVAPVDPQLLNSKGSLFLTRPTMVNYTETREELVSRANDIYGWAAEGKLNARVGLTLPLEQAADAHRALEGRKTTGKVVLVP